MTDLLDTMGPAIWRASWQASVLAVLVAMLVRCFGERVTPRYRFLLWGVVMTRLLLVVTPVSPFSLFNVACWNLDLTARTVGQREDPTSFTPASPRSESTNIMGGTNVELPRVVKRCAGTSAKAQMKTCRLRRLQSPPKPVMKTTMLSDRLFNAVFITRVLSSIWLTGCLFLSLKLLATAIVLRRRLSACRPVTDTVILKLLETSCRQIGLERTPVLLVTPEWLKSLRRGNLESKNRLAGVVRDAIIERANAPCAGARTGASCTRRSVVELVFVGRADTALVQPRRLVDRPRNAGRT